MINDVFFLAYLFRLGCAAEIGADGIVVQIPPTFLTGMVVMGRPFCQIHEEYAAMGGRVAVDWDIQKGPAAGWLPDLFPGGK